MAAIIGGIIAGIGAAVGGSKAAKGAKQAQNAMRDQYWRVREDLSPYRGIGDWAVPFLQQKVSSGYYNPKIGDVTQTPGYQFRLSEGQKALENSAIQRGGLLSGNAMRAITDYGQNFASNEYDKEYNREASRLATEYSQLFNLANLGFAANSQTAGVGTSTANSIANIAQNQGNQQANMWSNLGSDIASAYAFQQAQNSMRQPNYYQEGGHYYA